MEKVDEYPDFPFIISMHLSFKVKSLKVYRFLSIDADIDYQAVT